MEDKYCFNCDEDHLEIVDKINNIKIKDVEITYTGRYLYCPVLKEYYEDMQLLGENLETIRNEFITVTGKDIGDY